MKAKKTFSVLGLLGLVSGVPAIVALPAFYPAEAYHQNYAEQLPDDLYIRINYAPKLVALKRVFPDLYGEPARSR